MINVKNINGKEIDYAAAIMLMDTEICEELHMEMAPCTEQEFIERYAAEHEKKFGEGFTPYVGGAW